LRGRRRSWGYLAVVTTVGVASLALVPTATASPLSAKRAEAARVAAEVDSLTRQAGLLADRYAEASRRLDQTRTQIATTTLRIHAATRTLHAAEDALAQMLVQGYKSSGEVDATAYVLSSGSFQQLVTRMDVMDRVAQSHGDLVENVKDARRQLEAARRDLRDQEQRRRQAKDQAHAAEESIRAVVQARSARLAGLRSDIRRLVEAEQARLARQAAAAAAAAEQAAASAATPATLSAPPAVAPAAGVQQGLATWYGPGFEGQPTASGELFDPNAMTAAHRWLPFGTRVRVTDVASGRSVVVRINDRGPFSAAIIDLTPAAANALGIYRAGSASVRVEPLG
jgi:rare lipoprotein A (peptidoglycan hydrolase)